MNFSSSHPIRTVSRSALRRRSGKLRVLWFFAGSAFGVFTALHLMQPAEPTSIVAIETQEATVAAIAETDTEEVTLVEADGSAVAEPDTMGESGDSELMAGNEPVKTYPVALDLKVASGDTLINMLTDAGVASDEAYTLMQAMKKKFDPKKLNVGQNVSVLLDKPKEGGTNPTIARMVLPMSLTSSMEIHRGNADDFSVKLVDVPVERKIARAGGRITSSLYETAAQENIPLGLVAEIINAYSYDIDFQRDIQSGDEIDVLYERTETKDGTPTGQGEVIFAELTTGKTPLRIYRYTDKSGFADYYNLKGESVRKALLRTPVNGARITSGFGKRKHPILGYSRMHRGIDFGAPAGTPIYAAGDGKVEFAARKGGYGNYLRIRHNGQYATAYGHISRFAKDIKPGVRVKQGQVVAYVGSTGQSTGPHLHYEVISGGTQINPSKVKFKTGTVLKGTELASFKQSVSKIEAQLAAMPRGTKLAMAGANAKTSN